LAIFLAVKRVAIIIAIMNVVMRVFSYAFKLSFNCLALRTGLAVIPFPIYTPQFQLGLTCGVFAFLAGFSLGSLPVACSWSMSVLMC